MMLVEERRRGFWKWTHTFHRSEFPGSIIRNKHRRYVEVVMAETTLQQQTTQIATSTIKHNSELHPNLVGITIQ